MQKRAAKVTAKKTLRGVKMKPLPVRKKKLPDSSKKPDKLKPGPKPNAKKALVSPKGARKSKKVEPDNTAKKLPTPAKAQKGLPEKKEPIKTKAAEIKKKAPKKPKIEAKTEPAKPNKPEAPKPKADVKVEPAKRLKSPAKPEVPPVKAPVKKPEVPEKKAKKEVKAKPAKTPKPPVKPKAPAKPKKAEIKKMKPAKAQPKPCKPPKESKAKPPKIKQESPDSDEPQLPQLPEVKTEKSPKTKAPVKRKMKLQTKVALIKKRPLIAKDIGGHKADQRNRKMKLFGMWTGPKRHRVASLNATAKVHCLYENESRSSMLDGLEIKREYPEKKAPVVKTEVETPPASPPSTRTLRSVPGLRVVGKMWDMHDTTSSSSSEEDISEPEAVLRPKPKPKPKPKPAPKPELKPEPKPPKEKAPKQRRKRAEIIMDLKDMVVRKRMASLNASAILAASYSVEKRGVRGAGSDSETETSESEECFSSDDDIKKCYEEDVKKEDERKVIEVRAAPNKKVAVILNQDTDVTITGVYVNSTTRSTHHEGFCSIAGMQYRISATSHTQTAATAVATETILQSASTSSSQESIPSSAVEWMQVAQQYEEKWNFPHCIGALDGKHVITQAPMNSGSEFINYKGTFSIVLMALVDANYRFIFADVGCQGRISDGGVFKNTSLFRKIEHGQLMLPQDTPLPTKGRPLPFVFVADDAFGLSTNIMKPYAGLHEKGSKERVFNYRLSRARRVVENVFGILASVFRVLRKPMLLQPDRATNITMACVLLHNFLRRSKTSNYIQMNNLDHVRDGQNIPGLWRRDENDLSSLQSIRKTPRQSSIEANLIRNEFADYFLTSGKVPWQYLYS